MSITLTKDRMVKIYPDFEIVFVIDPTSPRDAHFDSTIRLIHAFKQLNHAVYCCSLEDLFLEQGKVYAAVSLVVNLGPLQLGPPHIVCLDDVAALVQRIPAPMDSRHLQASHMLRFISPDVCQFNSIRGLRDVDERLLALNWPHLAPPTVATADLDRLKQFLQTQRRIVIKRAAVTSSPKTQILDTDATDWERDLNRVIEDWQLTETEPYIVAQKYLLDVKLGEKRITVIDSEVVDAVKYMPVNNAVSVGKSEAIDLIPLSESDRKLVAEVSPTLSRWGLSWFELTVIGDLISRIRVFCPSPAPNCCVEQGESVESRIVAMMAQRIQKQQSPVFQMKPGCC